MVNGKTESVAMQQGYAVFRRAWKKGDQIHIVLPMPIRTVQANSAVEADRDKIAIQRGPLMYCAEWPDNKDGKVLNLMLTPGASLSGEFKTDFLHGLPNVTPVQKSIYEIKAGGEAVSRINSKELKTEKTTVNLIPYYAWAYRGAGEMSVWLAQKPSAAQPLPSPTVASTSKVSGSRKSKTLMSLNDQMVPKNSNDQSIVFYHWWPKKDTVQWLQYDFEKPATIASSNVYWFDDGPDGGCRIPAGWRLLYREGDAWVPVNNKTPYEILKDAISGVTFAPVTTTALRMEITLPKEFSSGVMEWSVE